MPSDYYRIAQEIEADSSETIKRFIKDHIANQYSDPTHFIYELLQNAEDARATRVEFRLFSDRLELEHDGDLFTEADVISICRIMESTKVDESAIGKFGIGFKSVYTHTLSPNIHSGDEHFTIVGLRIPKSIDAHDSRLGTLFVLPFDAEEIEHKDSFTRIAGRLEDLKVRTLLFLKHITEISYEIDGGASGLYLKQVEKCDEDDFASTVKLLGQSDEDIEENWLVFHRGVSRDGRDLTVEIAFRVREWVGTLDSRPEFQALTKSPLYVFFPTKQETRLGFLMQGRFRTTPNRESILVDNDYNEALFRETAELVVKALHWLSEKKWLTVEILQTMPLAHIESDRFYDYNERRYISHDTTIYQFDSIMIPIYERIKWELQTEELIPASGGGYVSGNDAVMVTAAALQTLLGSAHHVEHVGINDRARWISEEITEARTELLWRYLTDMLRVKEIDTEKFVRRLSNAFLTQQTDDWIRRLYEFLPTGLTMKNIIRDKPIIRLDDCDSSHVPPFKNYNEPNAYLPTVRESRFPTVSKAVCSSEKALSFLRELGLNEPDIIDEVVELILPKYGVNGRIDDDEHLQDVALIVQALSVDSLQRRATLKWKLANASFLRATSATGASAFCRPQDLYFRSPELESYFAGNSSAWFISGEYDQYRDAFCELGVAYRVRVECKTSNAHGHVTLKSRHGQHERGLHGFDPNWSIDSLDFALAHPSIERSQVIWNKILIPHKHLIEGEIESCPRQTFAGSTTETKLSSVGKKLCEQAWLPNGAGEFVIPSALALDDLPSGFRRDDELARLLGMKTSMEALLQNHDIPDEVKRIIKLTSNRSPEQIAQALALYDEGERLRQTTPGTMQPGDYASEFADTFDSPEAVPPASPTKPIAPIRITPDARQSDAERDIGDELDAEERYQLRVQRVWDPKNPETRRFLYDEYGGECQICDDTFEKRDGQNYFEAVHLVGRSRARFLDHPRNALCLCANHSAQFHAGEIATPEDDIVAEVISSEESQPFDLDIMLCGEPQTITFTANHIDELRGVLEASQLF